MLRSVIRSVINLIRLVLGYMMRILEKADGAIRGGNDVFDKNSQYRAVKKVSSSSDMYSMDDEKFYAEEYWQLIKASLEKNKVPADARIVDLACGQGRMTVKLARWCDPARALIEGVDINEDAIKKAHVIAKSNRLSRIIFKNSDVRDFLKAAGDNEYNAVLFLEAVYMMGPADGIFEEIFRILKPGGIAAVSYRAPFYNVLEASRLRYWKGVDIAVKKRSGNVFGGDMYFTWNSHKEMEERLSSIGFIVETSCGIGCLSGLGSDPYATVARPSRLSLLEKEALLKAELEAGDEFKDNGRYILTIVRK